MVWGGTVTGDAAAGNFTAPYSDDEFSDMLAMILTYDRTTQGVIRSARTGYSGNLAVTNPAGVTIRVATGLALVDGKLYSNSANIDNVVVAPGSGSNFYRIVLQKDFTAQTVRVALIGPDIAAFPAVTQTDGVLWEISLAGIEITSAAAVTITDERDYCAAGVWFRMGNDAIQADTGGNARGAYAIDAQQDRDLDTQVASGQNSFIAGGKNNTASGPYSHAEGYSTVASDNHAHAEGYDTNATARAAHAEGYETTASAEGAHAEGYETTASEVGSHAEGTLTVASGLYAHAEGAVSIASGDYSHAQGFTTTASANYAHAQGLLTQATATCSFAAGESTEATAGGAIAMGLSCVAAGTLSMALGRRAKTGANNGVFIWADFTDADFTADRANQFKVRASGSSHFTTPAGSALATVTIEQLDDDDTFINFVGTSAADQTKSISTKQGDGVVDGPKIYNSTAGWAFVGMVKVDINGTARWMPYYQEDLA